MKAEAQVVPVPKMRRLAQDKKPGVVDRRIEIRETLCLTLDFDHDVVDGAPAARFAKCLVDSIENGDGIA